MRAPAAAKAVLACLCMALCVSTCRAEFGCYEAFRTDYPHCRDYESHGYTCVGNWCVTDRCRGDCSDCAEWRAGYVPDFAAGRCRPGAWAAGEALNVGSYLSKLASTAFAGRTDPTPGATADAPRGGGRTQADSSSTPPSSGARGLDLSFWGAIAGVVLSLCFGKATALACAGLWVATTMHGLLGGLAVPVYFVSGAYLVLTVVWALTSSLRWLLAGVIKLGIVAVIVGVIAVAVRSATLAANVSDVVRDAGATEALQAAADITADLSASLQHGLQDMPAALREGIAVVQDTLVGGA